MVGRGEPAARPFPSSFVVHISDAGITWVGPEYRVMDGLWGGWCGLEGIPAIVECAMLPLEAGSSVCLLVRCLQLLWDACIPPRMVPPCCYALRQHSTRPPPLCHIPPAAAFWPHRP